MINLLIADDEPLVQAGIKSILNWEEYDINIVGTAANGAAAYEMIKEQSPDIVITDIKMPVMDGLELVKKCYEEQLLLPVFIILTSYEEFEFAKKALNYQVINYLVKLELTPETLSRTLEKAIDKVNKIRKASNTPGQESSSLYFLQEQFYTRLILNLFESEHHFKTQCQNLNLNFDYDAFAACYMGIYSEKLSLMAPEKQLSLYTSSLQMAKELTCKYIPCHILSVDTKHFVILFFLDQEQSRNYRQVIPHVIEHVSSMLFNYYSVTTLASVGPVVPDPIKIASSFQEAKQFFPLVKPENPILFSEDASYDQSMKNIFNISLFKEDIRKAYAEFDEKALHDIFTAIMDLFENQPAYYLQALDAAGNILYLSLSLLNNGEQLISEIFRDRSNGYRSLYELTSVSQIIDWLAVLRDGLCSSFSTYHKDYKNRIVLNVKRYIQEHVEEKLTLNKVSEVFNISPSYLSVLFSKYNHTGFTDYINQTKVEAAKKMMADDHLKIYEISDALGFESAFYFSRVFKKVTGISPRDYMNQNSGAV